MVGLTKFSVLCFAITSGLIINKSLHHLSKMNEQVKLNKKQMLLHGTAFGLYLVAASVDLIVFLLALFSPSPSPSQPNKWFSALLITDLVGYYTSFVSMTLLAAIFWKLGNKKVADENQSDASIDRSESSLSLTIYGQLTESEFSLLR